MTLEQKVNQMSGDESLDSIALSITREYNKTPYYGGEDPELGLPAVKFSDGPTGWLCITPRRFRFRSAARPHLTGSSNIRSGMRSEQRSGPKAEITTGAYVSIWCGIPRGAGRRNRLEKIPICWGLWGGSADERRTEPRNGLYQAFCGEQYRKYAV